MVEAFEDRTVPAAFSFQFADGTVGSGLFSTPVGYDPTTASQTLPVKDLTVMVGGVAYAPQPGVTAEYVSGGLVGVTGAASGPGGILEIVNDRVNLGANSVTAAYDGATTQATFVLKHPTTETVVGRGAVSYDIPWQLVNPQLADQSLAAVNFRLNIAGQNLTEGSARFVMPPTLKFEFGVLTGVTFDANTASVPDFRFTRITATGSAVSADDRITGTKVAADLAPTGSVILDLTPVQGDVVVAAGSIKITVTTEGKTYTSEVTFQRAIARDVLARLVARDLADQGVTTAKAVGNSVEFGGNANDPLKSVVFEITNNRPPVGGRSIGVRLTINGAAVP